MSRHDKRVTICSVKEKGWVDDDLRCLCGDQRGKAPWGRIVSDICPSVSGGYTCRREELLSPAILAALQEIGVLFLTIILYTDNVEQISRAVIWTHEWTLIVVWLELGLPSCTWTDTAYESTDTRRAHMVIRDLSVPGQSSSITIPGAAVYQGCAGATDDVMPHKDGDRFNTCQVIYSQFGLAIHQNDHQARRRFVEWAQNEIAVVPDFHKRILFSDEAHFWLNGYVNKQNCRIWSEANPHVYVETPLHPEKLTVWCALWAGGIIGPYFFKNDEGHNVTVNGDRYRAMITNFFIPELNNHDVQELWFQQDGATCHTARATIDLLKDTFGDRLISRFGPVN
ncbi:transposable element Tc3 transposase [Trichonephila clavipes]|nr:transposable element Tc3 transposase [Trichonephila clavipes]